MKFKDLFGQGEKMTGRYVWLVESAEYFSAKVQFIQHKFL
jgi:hypothetical protein